MTAGLGIARLLKRKLYYFFIVTLPRTAAAAPVIGGTIKSAVRSLNNVTWAANTHLEFEDEYYGYRITLKGPVVRKLKRSS